MISQHLKLNLKNLKIISNVIQKKAAWFENRICVSSASFITTLLTVDNGPFLSVKFC